MVFSDIILGLCLLFAGRKLFWLSVGVLGFIVGMQYAPILLPEADGFLIFGIAIAFGILGAVLALSFEWIAILFIGFLGGAYFLANVSAFFSADAQLINTIAIIGGIVGIFVMAIAFDTALIVISSLVGGLLITNQSGLTDLLWILSFLFCLTLGIFMQSFALEQPQSKRNQMAT